MYLYNDMGFVIYTIPFPFPKDSFHTAFNIPQKLYLCHA